MDVNYERTGKNNLEMRRLIGFLPKTSTFS